MEVILIREDKKARTLNANPLEVARLVATHAGYEELDVEPFPDNVKITATKLDGTTISASGPSELEAAEKFIDRLLTS